MPPDRTLDRLATALAATATPEAAAFWARLTRGALPSLGVPDVLIRTRMHAWWKAEKHGLAPPAAQRTLALGLLARPHVEEKLAGIHALAEILLPRLDLAALDELALALGAGCLPDPFTLDWLAAKVLGPLTTHARDREAVARALAAWIDSPAPGPRRLALTGLASLAAAVPPPFPGLADLVLANAAALLARGDPDAASAVAWTLGELARSAPARVEEFLAGPGRALPAPDRLRLGQTAARQAPCRRRASKSAAPRQQAAPERRRARATPKRSAKAPAARLPSGTRPK